MRQRDRQDQLSSDMWPLVNEAVANRGFPDLAALEDRVGRRCVEIMEDADLIRAHTRFHWWPNDVWPDNDSLP